MERRVTLRLGTCVEVSCLSSSAVLQGEVRDISVQGCRLEIKGGHRHLCTPGKAMCIDLGGMAEVAGKVVWMEAADVGVEFDEPLDLKQYGILFWLERSAGVHFEQLTDHQIAA
ncbi:PilZ domain-containing protein [Croceibacterium aestuarii]|uniref:PilZ domain-containing protein n=1 Tax=Croceibacterium aestuarii TaxID=3064139 RepID=UPI00272EC198|nr:PilZ domain-containing protein [Croceibacterium sp. D39]